MSSRTGVSAVRSAVDSGADSSVTSARLAVTLEKIGEEQAKVTKKDIPRNLSHHPDTRWQRPSSRLGEAPLTLRLRVADTSELRRWMLQFGLQAEVPGTGVAASRAGGGVSARRRMCMAGKVFADRVAEYAGALFGQPARTPRKVPESFVRTSPGAALLYLPPMSATTPVSAGIQYRFHDTPATLAALTEAAARQHRIWIDTELADWNTPHPRLSLIQMRLEDGSIHVVDVLSPEMAAAYREAFVPRVIAAPQIEKWAHYARFERRVLGPDAVQGLHCTFELARSLPYYRLPLRSLKLAALVHHLFDEAIDKSYQKADWGRRPLHPEQLDYAAWDPEWCYRIHQRLQPLVQSWDPATDDPDAIQRRYVGLLPGLRDAKHWRTAIWDSIKAFMVAGERERFSDFLLQMRVIRTVPIPALAAAVAEVDPMQVAEFAVPVPAALLESLRPGGDVALREAGQETIVTRFLTPRAPRAPGKPIYDLDPEAPERVASEFAAADDEHRKVESERQELKDRMRAWMEHAKVNEWGGFEISDSSPRLRADVRMVADWLRDGERPSTGLPGRFLLAFSPRQIAALSEYVDGALSPVMRWRPDRSAVPIELAQSRDWHGDDEAP